MSETASATAKTKGLSIYEKLAIIQTNISVPKSESGYKDRYKYRTVDGILKVAKPAAKSARTTLYTSCSPKVLDGKVYFEAVAVLADWDSEETIKCMSAARDPITKDGMEVQQVSGTCVTYATKYALSALLGLDDNVDPDSPEYQERPETDKKTSSKKTESAERKTDPSDMELITNAQKADLIGLAMSAGLTEQKLCTEYGIPMIDLMTQDEYPNCMARIRKYKETVMSAIQKKQEEAQKAAETVHI